VANVQDRRLKLDVVKSIAATESEIRKYRLVENDLLLTEGGDPDKLGRGALWDDSIKDCIHQNHVFRVRVTSEEIHPLYLNWLVGSARGKRYFLGAAKQTTGIASINMSQLRRFPLLVPPQKLQRRFAELVLRIEAEKKRLATASKATEQLFESLQQRAFAGALLA
jgi:type I restriction enzyme S subunit